MTASVDNANPGLSVAEQQAKYWAGLYPIVPVLSDRELSLLALLVYWSGPRTVPGDRILKSWRTIAPRIGSKRVGGQQPANRQALSAAAARLQALGLVERTGTDAVWRVVPDPSALRTTTGAADAGDGAEASCAEAGLRAAEGRSGDDTASVEAPGSENRAVAPRWAGFAAFNARLWRREFEGAMSSRAAICRLTYALDQDGNWAGSVAEFAELLRVTPQTARKRIGEINASENDLQLSEAFEDGGLRVKVSSRFSAPKSGNDLQAELTAARDEVWYPELVTEAIARAGRLLKNGVVGDSRQLNDFYAPVLALQTEYANPPLLKYALEATLENGVLDGTKGKTSTRGWHRYTRKICQNQQHRFARASDQLEVVSGPIKAKDQRGRADGSAGKRSSEDRSGQVRQQTQQEPIKQSSLRDRELALRELLREAARLNGTGDHQAARRMLKQEIGPKARGVVGLFDGNMEHCRAAIALAFKQGSSDIAGVKPDEYAFDFFPEWSPKRWPPVSKPSS